MKNKLTALSAVALVVVTGIANAQTPDKTLDNPTSRAKIISSLLNNHAYMNELMDSMKHSHHAQMMMADRPDMMKSMMDDMMKNDATRKTMMNEMMNSAEKDKMMCKEMMDMMMSKPALKEQMEKSDEHKEHEKAKEEDHSEHHPK
jgi:glutamine synthetase adenylyltransferase